MSELSTVLQPVGSATGLPNAHYVDDATFAVERDRLLFSNWAGLTFAKNVPQPGDAVPVEFLGLPLVVLRDETGRVRVYQNTCRHRGMILVPEPTNVGRRLRCPYHSWCYSLEGRLVSTPHVGGPGTHDHPEVKRDGLGLIEISSHVWHDVVFVNVSGDAPLFEEYAADAIARWPEFETAGFVSGGVESGFAFDVRCNWKLAVENFCESYHLPFVHPGLNAYSRLEDHYNIEAEGSHSGQGTRVYRPLLSEEGRRFPDFPGLGAKWTTAGEYIALYPNVLLGVHRDHAFAIVLEPVAKDRTIEHVELYYSDRAVTGPDWAALRAANASMWHKVFEEDLSVVEGMQKGRMGLFFDGGRFSPAMDGPTHLFHRWVATRMQEAPRDH